MLKFCSSPWDTVNIGERGWVRPCMCSSWLNDSGSAGDLNNVSLTNIFNNSSFINQLRNSVIDQSFKFCNKSQCGKYHNLELVTELPTLPTLPTTLSLKLDKNCNLKCASCRSENIYSKEANKKTENILRILADDYKDFKEDVFVYCDGAGDIFASTAYQQFLRSDTVPKCFKFCITTNGNLITKNIELIKKLKDQIDIIIVSFDAATANTYKEVRGGNFELVVTGVEQLIAMGINVATQFVVQYKNYLEILDYVTLCKQLGVNHIGLQQLDRWGHMPSSWWKINKLDNNDMIDYEFLVDALTTIKSDPQCGICGGLEQLLVLASIQKISV